MSQTSQCLPAICKWVATVHVNTVSIQGAEIVDRSHSHSLGPVRTEIKGMWLNPRLDQQKMHSHLSEKDTDPEFCILPDVLDKPLGQRICPKESCLHPELVQQI